MFITDLFNLKKTCRHEKITPDMDSGYCPDCGKLIKNEWYITRCACCGVKLKTIAVKNEVQPQYHYCSNCGGKEYTVEIGKTNGIPPVNFPVTHFVIAESKVIKNEF